MRENDRLSPRETQTIQLIALGLSNTRIAEQMKISIHTVKYFIDNLLVKLGAENRTHAIVQAVKRGYLQIPSALEASDKVA